jgi:hypothetical protein
VNGGCHCGAVKIEIAQKPSYINDCNCSLCARLGVLWGYFVPKDVTVSGEISNYARVDRDMPSVIAHFCPTCGTTTHWTPAAHIRQDRMGVNMRLFGNEATDGVTLHYLDGASWNGTRPPQLLRASVILPLPVDPDAGSWEPVEVSGSNPTKSSILSPHLASESKPDSLNLLRA